MAIPKRKSLAGTCGIPQEKDRVYVKTFDKDGLERTYPPDTVPKRISAPFLGTWDVTVTVPGGQRDLWWEHGDWFVPKGGFRVRS